MASNLGAEPEEVIENLQAEGLKVIDELYPIMSQDISDKICEFEKKSGNEPYVHVNEGYVVVVKMTGEVDATDALMDYLRKRTELMY
ncbi:MAG: hypothetical protein Q4F83_11745 [Eubacteriales bacterium]|nr:hypothetical protein [Eubacteriales bacterium]